MRRILIALGLVLALGGNASAVDVLTVNYTSSKKQTYEGMEALLANYAAQDSGQNDAVYHKDVYELGVVQGRLEIQDSIETTLGVYDFTDIDAKCTSSLVRLNTECLARFGRPARVNLVYVGYGPANVAGHPHNPATSGYQTNLANCIVAVIQHVESTYGIKVNYVSECLEPDHTTQPINTQQKWADAALVLRAQLDSAHLQHVDIQGVESFQGSAANTWLTTIESTYPSSFALLKVFSYHFYGGNGSFATLDTYANSKGRPAWMTEHTGHDGQDFFDCLATRISLVEKYASVTLNWTGGQDWTFWVKHATSLGFPSDDLSHPADNLRLASIKVIAGNVYPGSQYLTVTGTNGRLALGFRRPDGKLVLIVREGAKSLTGTCATTAGSPNVVGTGTSFTTQLSIGSSFAIVGDSATYTVQSITDNTHLALTTNAALTLGTTNRPASTSEPFSVANLLPGTYATFYADTNGVYSAGGYLSSSTIKGSYLTGPTFVVHVKAGPSPVYQSSPTIDIPGAGSVVAIVQQ